MRKAIERAWKKATPEQREVMADADFDSNLSLSAAMGLLRCVHGGTFPCAQCYANRQWNESSTSKTLTDAEFEAQYAKGE